MPTLGGSWPWPTPAAGVATLLTTTHDRPVDAINAGQALQRILLTAAARGAAAALHTQPIRGPPAHPLSDQGH